MRVVSKLRYAIVAAVVTGCVQDANKDPVPSKPVGGKQEISVVPSQKTASSSKARSDKTGESPQKVLKEALEAQSNDPEALIGFAEAYYNGDGVPRNIAKSIQYFLKAAELGSGYACRRMGMEYSDFAFEDPTPRDDAKARKWFERGDELGDSESTYYLSEFVFQGRGGPKDEKRATALLIKAGKLGSQRAAHRALKLEHKHTISLSQDDKRDFFVLDRQLKMNKVALS
ncbi:MAG: sel1 repeat family protein [Holosporales bacterium]|jgi:TPR repeat protein|nr:sel1 repeat family protein [Holosporales bacterium]